jgi:leucyl-tRNA synthetase
MMFTSPPEDTLVWSDAGVEGAARFLRRLWTFAWEFSQGGAASSAPLDPAALTPELAGARREVHAILRQADYDIKRHQFNTVASAAMKILNTLERAPGDGPARRAVVQEGLGILLRLLSPITPHLAHNLWRELGFGADVLAAPWPQPDANALIEDEVELVVQVNGKKRGDVRVPREADKKTIEQMVLALPFVQKIVAGLAIKKIIIVPGRLVNVVV